MASNLKVKEVELKFWSIHSRVQACYAPSVFTEELYIERKLSKHMLMGRSNLRKSHIYIYIYISRETCIQVAATALAERLAFNASLQVTSPGLRYLTCKMGMNRPT